MKFQLLPLVALIAAIAGCASTPDKNPMLEEARAQVEHVRIDTSAPTTAPTELAAAQDSLARAEKSFLADDSVARVDQLSYLAKQRAVIAEEKSKQMDADKTVTSATADRDSARLAARDRDLANANQQTDLAKQQAANAQQQAATSQQQATDARGETAALESQLRELHGRQTNRGMVVTLSNVMFDTGKFDLREGGERVVEHLATILQQNPGHKLKVEGFTDSRGRDQRNLELSQQRGEAVKAALVAHGVSADQITTEGFGKGYPLSSNATASGRQLNRRVEVIISNDNNLVGPRSGEQSMNNP